MPPGGCLAYMIIKPSNVVVIVSIWGNDENGDERNELNMNETELKNLLEKAEHGDISACVNAGNYYNKQAGTQENRRRTFYYYKKAADLGYAPAQFKVGHMYYTGDGTRTDGNASAQYVKMAADKNYAEAQYAIACMYQSGEYGFIATEQKALKYFTKAAEQGHAFAQIELGDIYLFEKRQIDQAVFWWACAYAHGASASEACNKAKKKMEDLVESGVPGGYNRITQILEEVKQKKYYQYIHNPK